MLASEKTGVTDALGESSSVLAAQGVSKSYGPTIALSHADIELKGGEVHALFGENGAGKSTLVRILGGVVSSDSGSLYLDGKLYKPESIYNARKYGVATAFQELSLVPNLTVAQNLFLPDLSRKFLGIEDTKKDILRAEKYLAEIHLSKIDPTSRVDSLPLADRQRLEISRAFMNGKKVLVLDEPTASLAETDWLFQLIEKATSKNIAVLYISHRLAEVREICKSATVLRNGRSIASVKLNQATDDDIFEMMVGKVNEKQSKVKQDNTVAKETRMKVSTLTGESLKDVTFELKRGEVLGVAALEGQGQQNLFRMLAGLDHIISGEVLLDSKSYKVSSPRQALNFGSGVAFLPEERKTEGILAGMTAASNVVISIFSLGKHISIVNKRQESNKAKESADLVDFAHRYLNFPISDLSGGNQQKALMARVLATGAKTLLLFDPTRGVDVGTKESIYSAIKSFTNSGGAVLLYSSELPEIVSLADRCLVLHDSSMIDEFSGDALNEQDLVAAMTGHTSKLNHTQEVEA